MSLGKGTRGGRPATTAQPLSVGNRAVKVVAVHKRNRSTRSGAASRATARPSTRPTGREWRVAAWAARHPVVTGTPVLLAVSAAVLSVAVTASVVGGVALAVVVWCRAHPASFERWVAPRLRATWRRWTAYRGGVWRGVLTDCDLVREDRRTGEQLCPRVLRVRSTTPSIDVVTVRLVRGQQLGAWLDGAPTLADALGAHRVAVTRSRPGVLTVVVERSMPFEAVVPAPVIPTDAAGVDLHGLDVGDDEHGGPFLLPVEGRHVLVVGATGAGKGSLEWGPLRAMAPLLRDGLVRVRMIDLKGGSETERGAPLFYRRAVDLAGAVDLLAEFRDDMLTRQELARVAGVRRCTVCADTPLEILMIDELAMLTAYGDRQLVREALRLLAEVMTQGRAFLFSVMGYIQDPGKDVLDVRDLFTVRVCLGVTAASHVDMVLGEGARERGALADEIPGDEAHAGIGFVIDPATRLPVRFRAGYVTDTDIDELVAFCRTPGEVLDFPLPHRGDRDERDGAA